MSREDNICWFHGKVSRERAEEILLEEAKAGRGDGVFLVRESNSSSGDFVLSVLHKGKVNHYQIRRHGEDAFFSIDDNRTFHGLDSLIEYYQETSDGLEIQLSAIVKRDPPPNDSRRHGRTNLLHRSTQSSNHTIVAELLKCGYRSFDAKNQDGQTAIHLACLNSDEKMLKLLLTVKVNVNTYDKAGNTPLHYACQKQPGSFVKVLIDAKADIQLRNMQTGRVPLHEAAEFGNLDAVKILLEHGAPPMPRTKADEFPLDLARNYPKVREYLLNFTPKPPKTTKQLWYHGTLSRDEAQMALRRFAESFIPPPNETDPDDSEQQPDENQNVGSDVSGAFLLRYSDGKGYVLTLLYDDAPRNFIIRESRNGRFLYIDEGPYHPSLEHLVQHYMRSKDGLPVNLRYPVPPKPKPKPPTLSTLPKSKSKDRNHQNGSVTRSSHPNESPISPTHVPQRNLSLPGDEAMNRIGIFETNEDEDKKKIFRSLKLPSPKRNIIIDGMRSLRKSKSKKASRKEKIGSLSATTSPETPRPESEFKMAESLIKSLSFSTDFANLSLADGMYNTPTNNCAVVDIDIGEGEHSKLKGAQPEPVDSQKSENPVETRFSSNLCIEVIGDEKESEYYTKSDRDITIEREANEKSVFLDPPIPQRSFTTESPAGNSTKPPDLAYIPCIDVREFIDQNPSNTSEREESSTLLRELSQQPERLDSMMSRMSISSEFMDMFCRQMNTSSSSEDSASKMKHYYFIPYSCLQLGELIGSGEFASVYKGTLVQPSVETTGREVRYGVAIKTLKDEHCRSNKQEFLREASVMIRLQHHCIVKLIGISNGPTLMMVQELVSLGSMLNYITDNQMQIQPSRELKMWASQIACGMNYLESQHFVHRDLAARNILLSSRNQAKISDFGLSRALGNDTCYEAKEGGRWPIKWYAPESYNHGLFSHASDVWSYGVTLWEMFTYGLAPYGEMDGKNTIQYIETGGRLYKPQDCPDDIYKVMENCWNYNARDRPTFRYLTEYFLNDPNYQNLSELIQSEHIS